MEEGRGLCRNTCTRSRVPKSVSSPGITRSSKKDARGASLEPRGQAGCPEIDTGATHPDALSKQEIALPLAFRQASIGADNAVPRDAVRPGKDQADKPRRTGIDVPIGAHEPLRDRAHTFDDALHSRLAKFLLSLNPPGRG